MKLLQLLAILAIVTVAIWQLAPHFKDFQEVYRLRDSISYFWLLLALFSQSLQYIGDAWLCKNLFKITKTNISFKNILRISSMNVFAAHLLPVGQAGAIATSFYFYKKLGVTNQKFIFFSLSWSAITFFALISLFLPSLIALPELPDLPISYRKIAFIAIFIALLLAFLASIHDRIIWPKIKPLLKRHKIYKEIQIFKEDFTTYKDAAFNNKSFFIQALIAAFVYYISNISTLTLSFLTFGLFPPLPLIIFAYIASLIAGWVTLAPAGIGATDAALILIFLQFNIQPSEALAAVLLFRIISFWIPIPIGALAYLSLNKQIIKAKTII